MSKDNEARRLFVRVQSAKINELIFVGKKKCRLTISKQASGNFVYIHLRSQDTLLWSGQATPKGLNAAIEDAIAYALTV